MSGITDPAEIYFKDGQWTFDGSVWRPQNQLFAYRAVYRERQYTLAAAAGTNILTFSTVPAGEVWVIENICAMNVNTAASYIAAAVLASGNDYYLFDTRFDTITRRIYFPCTLTLAEGEYIAVVFCGCALNDDILCWLLGHKFKIAE